MSPDTAPRYRRRLRWPILTIIGLLIAGGVFVWAQVLGPKPEEATGCNEPGPVVTSTDGSASATATTTTTTSVVETTLGTFIDPESLAATRPADPTTVPVRVLNASTVTGQAKTVTDELRSAGFAAVGQQANDPLYPAADLRCWGEIRYGYAGQAEARTVLLVAPCAQLVLDDRADNSVDLSLGRLYQLTAIPDEVKDQLAEIRAASAPPPVIEGQTVAVRTPAPIPPLPDRSACPA